MKRKRGKNVLGREKSICKGLKTRMHGSLKKQKESM